MYTLTYTLPNGKTETLTASDNHPFYVKGKGWVDTIDLKTGMHMQNEQGQTLVVKGVQATGKTVTTFNLTVANDHTFFAGHAKVWVHNCNCGKITEFKVVKGFEDISLSAKTKSGVPGIKEGFAKWFDDLTPEQLSRIMKNPSMKKAMEDRIRHPTTYHEWFKVSKVETFKRWGVSMQDIWKLRTKTKDIDGINPPWKHGRKGSKIAHEELDRLVEDSLNVTDFKRRLKI